MSSLAIGVLKSFLLSSTGLYLVGLGAAALTAWGVNSLIKIFAKNPKLQPLEPLAKDLSDALTAAEKAALSDLASGKGIAAARDALAAAEVVGKADLPDLGTALKAEASVLIDGQKTTAVAPGGSTVNLPVIGTVSKPGSNGQRGVIPLIVLILLIGGGLIAAGAITLAATGNGKQDLSCAEAALAGSPTAFGNVMAGLALNGTEAGQSKVEAGIEALEPSIAKCLIVSLWDDYEVQKAQQKAMRLGVAAPAVASASPATIQAQAQAESVRRDWYPPGTVAKP